MSERLAKQIAKLRIETICQSKTRQAYSRYNRKLHTELSGYYRQLYLCHYWEDFYGEHHDSRKSELRQSIYLTEQRLKHLRKHKPY
jgi:hypothetical protein